MEEIGQANVFISAPKTNCVAALVEHLEKHAHVWLDRHNMTNNLNCFSAATSTLDFCDIAVVCLNKAFRTTEMFKSLYDYVALKKKPLIGLRMDDSPVRFDYGIWLDCRKGLNCKEISSKLQECLQQCKNQVLSSRSMMLINFHQFKPFLKRSQQLTESISRKVLSISQQSDTNGCFLVSGADGIGKTSTLSAFFKSKETQKYLVRNSSNRCVIYVNCKLLYLDYDLAPSVTSQHVMQEIVTLCHSVYKKIDLEAFETVLRPIFVFDNVQELPLLEILIGISTELSAPCCVVTENEDLLAVGVNAVRWKEMVAERLEIPPLSNSEAVTMLKETFGLKKLLSSRQVAQLVQHSSGLPRTLKMFSSCLVGKRPSEVDGVISTLLSTSSQKKVSKSAYFKTSQIARSFNQRQQTPRLARSKSKSEDKKRVATEDEDLELMDVPEFYGYYVGRPKSEAQILKGIQDVCSRPERGIFMVYGPSGVGKSTTVSWLLRMSKPMHGTNVVAWLNCCHLSKMDDSETVKTALTEEVVRVGWRLADWREWEVEPTKQWSTVTQMTNYYNKQQHRKILFVLDNVFHSSILTHFRECLPNTACIAITQNPRNILPLASMSKILLHYPKNDPIAKNPCQLEPMSAEQTLTILENNLKDLLLDKQIKELGSICSGLPLLTNLVLASLDTSENVQKTFSEVSKAARKGTDQLFHWIVSTLDQDLQQCVSSLILLKSDETISLSDFACLWDETEERAQEILFVLQRKGFIVRLRENDTEYDDPYYTLKTAWYRLAHCATFTDYYSKSKSLIEFKRDEMRRLGRRWLAKAGISEKSDTVSILAFLHMIVVEKDNCSLAKQILEQFNGKCGKFQSTSARASPKVIPKRNQSENGHTVMMVLAENGEVALMQALHSLSPANMQVRDSKNKTALMSAAGEGHLAAVKFLCEADGTMVLETDEEGKTAVMMAVEGNYFSVVKFLCEFDKSSISLRDENENSSLIKAIQTGNLDMVKYLHLLDTTAVFRANNTGWTAVMIAASFGYLDIVKFLCDEAGGGSTLQMTDEVGQTAMHYAAREPCDIDTIRFLHSKDASLATKTDDNDETPLMLAAQAGNLEAVQFFYNIDPTSVTKLSTERESATFKAADQGHVAVFRFLHSVGSSVTAMETIYGSTALMRAAWGGYLDIVKLCHEHDNSTIAQADENGHTALEEAADGGHMDVVRYLHEQNPNLIRNQLNDGKTALMAAVESQSYDICRYLASQDPSTVLLEDDYEETALSLAATAGCLEIVKYLVEIEPKSIYRTNENGETALHSAVVSCEVEVAKFLYACDSRVASLTNNEGVTLLMAAADSGKFTLVRLFVKHDPSSVLEQDDEGQTALMWALERETNMRIVKFLHGLDPSLIFQADANGINVLMRAAEYGHLDAVKFFLSQDPDLKLLHATDDCDETAIFKAAYSGYLDVVKVLYEMDPSLSYVSYSGLTGKRALMKGLRGGAKEIADFLKSSETGDADDSNEPIVDDYDVKDSADSEYTGKALSMSGSETATDDDEDLGEMTNENEGTESQREEAEDDERSSSESGGSAVDESCGSSNSTDEESTGTPKFETEMMTAAEKGQLAKVKALHQEDPSAVYKRNDDRETALMKAADRGRLEIVRFFCEVDKTLIPLRDCNNSTAMMKAIYGGYLKVVKCIHEFDATAIEARNRGETTLMMAVYSGSLDTVKFVCETSPGLVAMEDKQKVTALSAAVSIGNLRIAKYLHELDGSLISKVDDEGNTLLMTAIECSKLPMVKFIYEQDVTALGRRNLNGDTPLIRAASQGRCLDIVTYIYGLDESSISAKNNENETAFMMAAWVGCSKTALFLGDKDKAGISSQNKSGSTAMFSAASIGSLPIVEYIAENDPSQISQLDRFGCTALMKAAASGHLRVVQYLHEKDKSLISKQDNSGQTALMAAALHCSKRVVQYLVKQDASVILKQDKRGETALMKAAIAGSLKVVDILIQSDPAGVSIADESGMTAVMHAGIGNHTEVVKLFTKKDKTVLSHRDKGGMTTLMHSVYNLNIVKHLLLIDPDSLLQVANDGNTPAMLAAGHGKVEVVRLLVNKDGACCMQNNDGMTPLMMAAVKGNFPNVKFLATHDSSCLLLQNKSGQTAAEIAEKRYPHIGKYLSQLVAEQENK